MSHTHWKLISPFEQSAAVPGIHPLVVQLLGNRGIFEPSQAELFLNADQRLEVDPFLLPDMSQAVSRIYRALFSGEKIAIYGDFDADGITATALLVQAFSALGGDVIPYIPHRIQEGYGLKVAALEKLHAQGVSLVVTVDTGITAFIEAQKAQKMGLDLIITDHHVPLGPLPEARFIINPKRTDSAYPFSGLAGVGVAYKLVQAFLKGSGREELMNNLLDLVALGTVTDMVPLVGENRYWVKRGIEILNGTQRVGLQEMARCAGLEPGSINAERISWVLGPRLNAAGRMDDAIASYQLLLTENPQEANSLALELEEKNAERRRLTDELTGKAREKIVAAGADRPLLMVGGADYPPGVMGVVAGRLCDEFCRPVILCRTGTEVCRGSGRSIPEFDLMAALKECRELLSKFGGHARAAGFSLPTRNLSQLQNKLSELAGEQLAGVDLRPHTDIDAEVTLSAFAGDTFNQIQRLAPFGAGNPVPAFLSRKVQVVDCQPAGNQREHVRLKLKQEGAIWDAMGFHLGDHIDKAGSFLDIVYNLELNRWNGRESLRLNLLDLAEAK